MTWKAHEAILRLRSPLHIGCGQMGNLRRTRPYVIGRTLWGALTMRITRDKAEGRGAANDSKAYRDTGKKVHDSMAFTYFFPAVKRGDAFKTEWPWEDENAFRYRFLRSFAGTTLHYPAQSAVEGSLREVEYISPRVVDTGEPVFLMGYIFEKKGSELGWKAALNRLQLGGDRGYGWGDVELEELCEAADGKLFGGAAAFRGDGDHPVIPLEAGGRLLAHVKADGLPASGVVEPLVGREWRSNQSRNNYAGQHVEFIDVCYGPGGEVHQPLAFEIKEFGIWRRSGAAA